MTPEPQADPRTPGEAIRAALVESELTPNQLAKSMDVTPSCVWYLLHDRRGITANMARRLAVAMPEGPSAAGWLDIQRDWDLRPIEQEAGA